MKILFVSFSSFKLSPQHYIFYKSRNSSLTGHNGTVTFRVGAPMSHQGSFTIKSLPIVLTLERFNATVDELTCLQVIRPSERLPTLVTLVWFNSSMNVLMFFKVNHPCESLSTLLTAERFLSTVVSLVTSVVGKVFPHWPQLCDFSPFGVLGLGFSASWCVSRLGSFLPFRSCC